VNLPQVILTNAIQGGGPASSWTTSAVTTGVALGDAVLVALNVYVGSGTLSSLTDSSGNSYTLLQATVNNGYVTALGYCLSALALGGTFTVTLSSSQTLNVDLVAAKISGGLSALDVAVSATQVATNSLSVGPTGTTAVITELVIGAFGYWYQSTSVPTFSAGAGYSSVGQAATAASDAAGAFLEYQLVNTRGTQTATASVSAAVNAAGGVVAAFRYVLATTASAGLTLGALSLAAAAQFAALVASGGLTLTAPSLSASATPNAAWLGASGSFSWASAYGISSMTAVQP